MGKDFKEVVNDLEEQINNTPNRISASVQDSVYMMSEDIQRAKDSDSYSIPEGRVNMVRTALTDILNEVVLNDISHVIDIIEDYLLLCHNWNKVAKDKNIKRLTESINVIIGLQNNISELSDVFAELYEEVEATKHFAPPSYDIKKEFLHAQSDKFEEGF